MGSLFRFLLGLPGAALVTAILFLFMGAVISQDFELKDAEDSVKIDITAKLQDTDISNQAKDFKRPTLDTPPPPPPAVTDPSNRPALDGVRAAIPNIDVSLNIGTGFNPDRDAQPLVRIEPQYPDRCQGRAGSEEIVVVEFDVDPQGQTANAKVLDTTNSCLNRAAIRAVGRWKYQPKIVDNQPQWRRGVVTQFRFQLADG